MWSLKKVAAVVSVISLIAVGCAKDGETGPVGPVGPEGAIGPAGENANGIAFKVQYYTVMDTDWSAGKASKANADITGSVVSKGIVNVYRTTSITPDSSNTYIALPDGTFGYEYNKGNIVFLTPGFSGASFTTYYKVLVVQASDKIDGLDYSDYKAVEMVYGLED